MKKLISYTETLRFSNSKTNSLKRTSINNKNKFKSFCQLRNDIDNIFFIFIINRSNKSNYILYFFIFKILF